MCTAHILVLVAVVRMLTLSSIRRWSENNKECAFKPTARLATKGTREIDSFFSLFIAPTRKVEHAPTAINLEKQNICQTRTEWNRSNINFNHKYTDANTGSNFLTNTLNVSLIAAT